MRRREYLELNEDMSGFVELVEMGPRDGLQNEARAISVAEKVALVDLLSRCGFRRIEVASFVSPKWVPQMAGSAEVVAGLTRAPGVRYTGLVPNLHGLEAAVAAGIDEIAVFGSASEGFARANLNRSVADSLAMFAPVVAEARALGLPVRGYVSCITDCPFDGPTPAADVARVTEALLAMGVYEVSLGDTLGRATEPALAAMFDTVLGVASFNQLAGHFHDTGGRALANIELALDRGLRVFDSAVGGLGGCPYAPGAPGNVATEAVAARLEELGYNMGLDRARIADAAEFAKGLR